VSQRIGRSIPVVSTGDLLAATAKMRDRAMPDAAIHAFERAYRRLQDDGDGLLPDDVLTPIDTAPALEELCAVDPDALDRVALIKLNGGLATTMGLSQPKSLLEAKDGLSFLDVIVQRTLALRQEFGARLPLIFMNSDATRGATLAALARYPDLPVDGLAVDFLQHVECKLDAHTLAPVSWPAAPELEWCPPGHGDVYTAMHASGLLARLREGGYRWVLISNADNLGATLEPRIPAHLASGEIPFLMEVVLGTEADRKGGHIANGPGGRLVLRETAQVPARDEQSFRDYRRWRWYNTNNLWVALDRLDELLVEGQGSLDLPLIVNRKTVDPRDPDSTPVLQLETAMGAAIGLFAGAQLLHVPRSRFIPVKTTDDLLVLRSDAYALSAEREVLLDDHRTTPPLAALDRDHFGLLTEFEKRFPAGPPSLRQALRLVVRGDVSFERDVVVRGDVLIDNEDGPATTIAAGTVLGEPAGPL
jgi:UTP--glucose-1-phosphate uridylyltransferase